MITEKYIDKLKSDFGYEVTKLNSGFIIHQNFIQPWYGEYDINVKVDFKGYCKVTKKFRGASTGIESYDEEFYTILDNEKQLMNFFQDETL